MSLGNVGLIALNQIFEQLRLLGCPPAAVVPDELLKMVAARNYIPPRCEDQYGIVLLREYTRYWEKTRKKHAQRAGD